MKKTYTFIDLFAGAGGLSEGFIRAGYTPIAHIEMNKDACNTLKTRSAFHYLQKNGHSCISPWQYNHVIQRLWTL